jgi:hypothetical protein
MLAGSAQAQKRYGKIDSQIDNVVQDINRLERAIQAEDAKLPSPSTDSTLDRLNGDLRRKLKEVERLKRARDEPLIPPQVREPYPRQMRDPVGGGGVSTGGG